MSEDIKVPCPEIPWLDELSKLPNFTLPMGLDLKGMANLAVAAPTNCAVSFNLLAQITPFLANLKCVVEILGIVVALKDFATNPLSNGPGLIEAIKKAEDCLMPIMLPHICVAVSVYGALGLVKNCIDCFIELLDSLINFRLKIDLESAEGNPVLEASIECAQKHYEASRNSVKASFESVKVVLEIVGKFKESEIIPIPLNIEDNMLEIEFEELENAQQKLASLRDAFTDFFENDEVKGTLDLAKSVCVGG